MTDKETITPQMYRLTLNQNMEFADISIRRVPGGWIYTTLTYKGVASTFVPFNNEFQNITK